MKVIYIAGRYRDGRGEWFVVSNIREAERAALYVWVHGGVALCPHKNTALFGGAYSLPDKVWLQGDLELLGRCDAIWAIPGWDTSEGARAEVQYAKDLKLPVLFSQKDVYEFLHHQGFIKWEPLPERNP